VVEFENPIARAVFLRFVAPLVPVWLFGVVLVFALDRYSVGGSGLGTSGIGLLLALYSVLVAALVSLLYYREWHRSPLSIVLTPDGITGRSPRGAERTDSFGYPDIVGIHGTGFFPARVEARPTGGHGSVEWFNLTEENAARLSEAWGAWQERNRPVT
jgi:hypothetical protein